MQYSNIQKIMISNNPLISEVQIPHFCGIMLNCVLLIWIEVFWRSGRKLNNVESSLGALIFCGCGSGQKSSSGMSSHVVTLLLAAGFGPVCK
jgi:hypothetical protein